MLIDAFLAMVSYFDNKLMIAVKLSVLLKSTVFVDFYVRFAIV